MPNRALATPLRPALPLRRSRVMSSLPPPGAKREPLAKSAPATSAETKAGISAGSAEPSASNMTMTSPVAAANPQAMALPLPLRVWVIARTHGRTRCAVSMLPSTECPSTTMISCTAGRTAAIAGRTTSRLRASLRVGTTTDTRGLPLRCIVVLPPTATTVCVEPTSARYRPPGTPYPPGTRGLDHRSDRAVPGAHWCLCLSGPPRRDVTVRRVVFPASPAECRTASPVHVHPTTIRRPGGATSRAGGVARRGTCPAVPAER